jgi:hypothetical protein
MTLYDVRAIFVIEAENEDDAYYKLEDILEEYIPGEFPCKPWGIPRESDV